MFPVQTETGAKAVFQIAEQIFSYIGRELNVPVSPWGQLAIRPNAAGNINTLGHKTEIFAVNYNINMTNKCCAIFVILCFHLKIRPFMQWRF